MTSSHSKQTTEWSQIKQVQVVSSFQELVSIPMEDGVNALCWPRELPGDFDEIAKLVEGEPGISTIEEGTLQKLSLSPDGCVAREILLADLELLRSAELSPVLDCVTGSPREPVAFPTDVQSFHVDSATAMADTYICTYTGACSEGLGNDQALARIDDPAARSALFALYGGSDEEGFVEFLHENFHDLHYIPRPTARPYSFGRHNLWRIALAYPDTTVLPCIHRAPITLPGMPSRLLILS